MDHSSLTMMILVCLPICVLSFGDPVNLIDRGKERGGLFLGFFGAFSLRILREGAKDESQKHIPENRIETTSLIEGLLEWEGHNMI